MIDILDLMEFTSVIFIFGTQLERLQVNQNI